MYITDDSEIDNKQIASLAIEIYQDYILKDKKVPGFGHRYHNVDPRADKLMELAIKEGFIGPNIKLALALEDLIYEKKPVEITGLIFAALLRTVPYSRRWLLRRRSRDKCQAKKCQAKMSLKCP